MNAKKLAAYLALADEARASKSLVREIAALEQVLALGKGRSIPLLFRLAEAERRFDLVDESAARLTTILRLDPNHRDAARLLSLTLSNARLERPELLDPFGLQAALRHTGIDYDTVGRAAMDHLAAATPVGELVQAARKSPAAAAEKAIIDAKTYLTHPLLHVVLRQTLNRRYDVERLLTAIRRHLLLVADEERFANKDVLAFALSLVAQCWNNEHVFAETDEEKEALDDSHLQIRSLSKSGVETLAGIRCLVLNLLYRPLCEIDSQLLDLAPLGHLKPKALAQLLEQRIASDEMLRTVAKTIPSQLTSTGDPVTARVSEHYERNPYPRWISFHHPASGAATADLSPFFSASELSFLAEPYRVLVAGAGTGRHPIASAMRYHPNGKVIAIDLSRASLAYGAAKAQELGVKGVHFIQADLQNLDEAEGEFEIIEAVGVLHHTGDAFAAWRTLLDRLKPGGLMWIGLYSAVARANILALRQRPTFPGASASDAIARSFRAELIADDQSTEAARLLRSDDFYALSDFRDLVMNAHESQFTIPEIQSVLDANGLRFGGFTAKPELWRAFKTRYPTAQWPGHLDLWWDFENENPTAFDGMYLFWCIKTT